MKDQWLCSPGSKRSSMFFLTSNSYGVSNCDSIIARTQICSPLMEGQTFSRGRCYLSFRKEKVHTFGLKLGPSCRNHGCSILYSIRVAEGRISLTFFYQVILSTWFLSVSPTLSHEYWHETKFHTWVPICIYFSYFLVFNFPNSTLSGPWSISHGTLYILISGQYSSTESIHERVLLYVAWALFSHHSPLEPSWMGPQQDSSQFLTYTNISYWTISKPVLRFFSFIGWSQGSIYKASVVVEGDISVQQRQMKYRQGLYLTLGLKPLSHDVLFCFFIAGCN